MEGRHSDKHMTEAINKSNRTGITAWVSDIKSRTQSFKIGDYDAGAVIAELLKDKEYGFVLETTDGTSKFVFDIKPRDAIEVSGSSNMAIINMPGGQPVIQSLGPNKSNIAFSGLLLHEDAKLDRNPKGSLLGLTAFERAKILEGWQREGLELNLTFGPMRRRCIIQYFKYAVKRFNMIEYQMNLVIDEIYSTEGVDKFPLKTLLGGDNSTLFKLYDSVDKIAGTLKAEVSAATRLASSISRNVELMASTGLGAAGLPAKTAVSMKRDIADARARISAIMTNIQADPNFSLWSF